MTNLELLLILFPVDYLKEILIPETNNILKHPMDFGKFIQWLGCQFYMDFWVVIMNRRNWWSTAEPKISGGAPYRLNKYFSGTRFEVILGSLRYKYQNNVEYYYGFFHMHKNGRSMEP